MGLFTCFRGKGKKDSETNGNTANKASAPASGHAAGAASNAAPANSRSAENKDAAVSKKGSADARESDLTNSAPAQVKAKATGESTSAPHANARAANPANAENDVAEEIKEKSTDMSEAQRREAEYLAMEREQQKKLVIRVTKWVTEAEQCKDSWMKLGINVEEIQNIEDFSDDEGRPVAKQSAARSNSEDQATTDKVQQSSNRIPSAPGMHQEAVAAQKD